MYRNSFYPLKIAYFIYRTESAALRGEKIMRKRIVTALLFMSLFVGLVPMDAQAKYVRIKSGEIIWIDDEEKELEFSTEDIEMTAKLIYAEAGGDILENKIGVAEVVLNRVKSDYFPDNVNDVITQENQFADYTKGKLTKANIKIASDVLNGKYDLLKDNVLYFRNPDKIDGAERKGYWGREKKYEVTLGLHDFYSLVESEVKKPKDNNIRPELIYYGTAMEGGHTTK